MWVTSTIFQTLICATYTGRSKSSRTKAIKTKKKGGYFFSVYLFKIGSNRCNIQGSTCFQLLHGVRKAFCGNFVLLVARGFLNLFNCIKPCTLHPQLHLREQEVVGGRQICRVWGVVQCCDLFLSQKLSNYDYQN